MKSCSKRPAVQARCRFAKQPGASGGSVKAVHSDVTFLLLAGVLDRAEGGSSSHMRR